MMYGVLIAFLFFLILYAGERRDEEIKRALKSCENSFKAIDKEIKRLDNKLRSIDNLRTANKKKDMDNFDELRKKILELENRLDKIKTEPITKEEIDKIVSEI